MDDWVLLEARCVMSDSLILVSIAGEFDDVRFQ